MKRALKISILMIISVLMFSSCGNKTKEKPNNSEPIENISTKKVQLYPIL